jgi:hypothetical protein
MPPIAAARNRPGLRKRLGEWLAHQSTRAGSLFLSTGRCEQARHIVGCIGQRVTSRPAKNAPPSTHLKNPRKRPQAGSVEAPVIAPLALPTASRSSLGLCKFDKNEP